MRMMKPLLLTLLSTVLAACAGGQEQLNTQMGIASAVRETIIANREARNAPELQLTRALLDQITVPSLEVVAENREQTAYLVPFSRRGPVTIWRTVDGAQVVLREGLVTATRGIGLDLASSDYAQTLRAIRSGSGSVERSLYLRNGLGGQDKLTLTCRMSDRGVTALDVVERTYQVRHLVETCSAGATQVSNEYWVEPQSGLIRQSRQWMGPDAGFLSLRLLKS